MKNQPKKEAKDRRSLLAGLTETGVDPSVEKAFVFGAKANPTDESPAFPSTPTPAAEAREGQGQPAASPSRVPLTTRVRSDFAAALKRASLQRQLNGELPNTLQDSLEEALEPWLRSKGYLS
jgi:hypothetical protein